MTPMRTVTVPLSRHIGGYMLIAVNGESVEASVVGFQDHIGPHPSGKGARIVRTNGEIVDSLPLRQDV